MNQKNKGVLVFSHLKCEGAASLGDVMDKRGLRIRTLTVPAANLDDIDPLRPDLLVIMGGPIGVYQKEDYPFLKKEIEIVRARIEKDLPTLGICLGSQIIAAAAGSEVFKGAQGKELGWYPLMISEVGQATEARHLDQKLTNMFHWHGDTFGLPENATLLASSKAYENQIFQIGDNIMALQSHPEVTQSLLDEWFVMFVGQITGDNPTVPLSTLRADTKKYAATMEKQSAIFFNEWLEKRGF